ncbi:MAG: CRISPR-associated protein Cas4 [Bacillota bacterium]
MLKLRVSDIKQYFYCPRIIYFNYVCPVQVKVSRKMEYGRQAHIELDRLEKRRTFKRYNLSEGKRFFHTHLYSPRLGLEGKLDMFIEVSGEVFPVEFKNTSGGLALNHKYQLVAYAMLLEDHFARPVRYGFVYLNDQNGEVHPVEITPHCREFVKETLSKIRYIIGREKMPPAPGAGKRCTDCEYRNYCGDVE